MSRNIATKVTDMLSDWARKDTEAQTEAVTRLGLPKNNTAKDRAKAMGFSDETYYHGTSEDFNEFNDVTTYVSPSPDIATDFAFMDNGGGYALDGAELTEDMLYRGHGRQYSQPNIMPLKVRASDTFDYANPNHIDEISPRVGDASIERIEGGNYEDIEDVIPEIKRKDFDSIRVNESQKAGFDSTIDNLGIFNPNGNIRSKFAHFNPKMAGVGSWFYNIC